LNPVYYKEEFILDQLKFTPIKSYLSDIGEVVFFGAGCSDDEGAGVIKNILSNYFISANINVHSDIKAAAISSLRNKSGISIILGTGSNIAICHNNGEISETRSGNGFILGDEGSGSHIGRLLITDYMNNKLPPELKYKLEKDGLTRSKIILEVYRGIKPNLFLASFSKFIHDNFENEYCKELVRSSITSLIKIYLSEYVNSYKGRIGIVGSVGYYFKEIVEQVFLDFGFNKPKILQKPIDGLVSYYLSNN
jgi:hypothetical protein